jgi:mono/diheme cytochrome c family protein
MAVLVFVLFWVSVAIGLVVLGLRSGRRGQPGGVQMRRGGRWYWYASFALILLGFGGGIPIASSIGRENDSKSNPEVNIRELTAAEQHGRELFHQFCSACHTLAAAKAVAQVGPNLDTLRPTRELVLDAIKNGRARGNGAMARDLVIGEDAEDVAAFVAAAVGKKNQ